MDFWKDLGRLHVFAKEIPCLTDQGAPTPLTQGAPGVLYMDTDTGALYKCRGGKEGAFRWESLLTEADKAELVSAVIEALGGSPAFGTVDEENNIIISGLPDGAYTVKYEMADGITLDIGELVLDNNTYYSITQTLTNCVSSNGAAEIAAGGSYWATITASSGYELESVTVTMGGMDLSADAVSGGTISIAEVTGDIVIAAVAKEAAAPAYTNLLPLAVDADGNPYVGTNGEQGYKAGYKMSGSSGGESATDGAYCSGFIPVNGINDLVRIKNITEHTGANVNNILFYDADKTKVYGATGGVAGAGFHQYVQVNNGIYSFLPHQWTADEVAFFRFSCGGITDETIVTINEEIV